MLQRPMGNPLLLLPILRGGGTDDNLACNFYLGKSCQGNPAWKLSPRPLWRFHYSIRKCFSLVPWGNEAFVVVVSVCAYLSPDFSKNFKTRRAILAV